jgi:hypothetical protein
MNFEVVQAIYPEVTVKDTVLLFPLGQVVLTEYVITLALVCG